MTRLAAEQGPDVESPAVPTAGSDPDADEAEPFYPDFYTDGPDAGAWVDPRPWPGARRGCSVLRTISSRPRHSAWTQRWPHSIRSTPVSSASSTSKGRHSAGPSSSSSCPPASDAYTLDLREYVDWCTEHHLAVFGGRRADIECFARHLESLGRARATIARRLCTVACFYRYAEQERLIAVSSAAQVRRPRLDYESHATGLDRSEVGAMPVAGADIEDLGLERGHRTLTTCARGQGRDGTSRSSHGSGH